MLVFPVDRQVNSNPKQPGQVIQQNACNFIGCREAQELVFIEYKRNGYLEYWETAFECDDEERAQQIVNLAEAGLFTTEIAELLEDVRDQKRSHYGIECADIVIRVMNFCSRNNINLEEEIIKKNQVNMNREKLHGRKL